MEKKSQKELIHINTVELFYKVQKQFHVERIVFSTNGDETIRHSCATKLAYTLHII